MSFFTGAAVGKPSFFKPSTSNFVIEKADAEAAAEEFVEWKIPRSHDNDDDQQQQHRLTSSKRSKQAYIFAEAERCQDPTIDRSKKRVRFDDHIQSLEPSKTLLSSEAETNGINADTDLGAHIDASSNAALGSLQNEHGDEWLQNDQNKDISNVSNMHDTDSIDCVTTGIIPAQHPLKQKIFFSVPKICIPQRNQNSDQKIHNINMNDNSDKKKITFTAGHKVHNAEVSFESKNILVEHPERVKPTNGSIVKMRPSDNEKGIINRIHSQSRDVTTCTIQKQIEDISKVILSGNGDIQDARDFLQNEYVEVTDLFARLCEQDDIASLAENILSMEHELHTISEHLDVAIKALQKDPSLSI